MPNLFGLDIAGIIDSSLQAAGGVLTGTLIRTTAGARTADDLLAGPARTTVSYPFRGFIDNRSTRRDGTVQEAGESVLVLGASLPEGIEPTTGDQLTIEGRTFRVVEVPERDPAAATYRCRVQD